MIGFRFRDPSRLDTKYEVFPKVLPIVCFNPYDRYCLWVAKKLSHSPTGKTSALDDLAGSLKRVSSPLHRYTGPIRGVGKALLSYAGPIRITIDGAVCLYNVYPHGGETLA